MDSLNNKSTTTEQMQTYEFDVVQFVMRAVKGGQYSRLTDLQAGLKAEFPACDEAFLSQCIKKVWRSLQ
jgi:hypothetical protein